VQVEAYWRGSIVVRAVPAQSVVTSVRTRWPEVGAIDAHIVEDLGALPQDPQQLEQERRLRFVALTRDALDQPEAFSDSLLDAWLQEVGATGVGDLLTRARGVVLPGTVRVAFSPPLDAPPSPVLLPISAAILIRDAGFSVAGLLRESKAVRSLLAPQGVERPHDPILRPRGLPLIVWMIPEGVFDDEDWPGGEPGMNAAALRAARRQAAGQWLLREGIGLAAVPA
jgi:hypothetical protein